MKTISLLAFHNKVKELAEKAGKTYSSTTVYMSEFYDKKPEFKFTCYVNGFEHFTGKTPENAIAQLKLAMFPPKQSISDVVVEVEGGEEV